MSHAGTNVPKNPTGRADGPVNVNDFVEEEENMKRNLLLICHKLYLCTCL